MLISPNQFDGISYMLIPKKSNYSLETVRYDSGKNFALGVMIFVYWLSIDYLGC